MKGSVNLEFRDEDLRRFAEDVMRRGALHVIGELFKQVINDPRLSHLAREAFRGGVEIGREGRGGPSTDPSDFPMPPGMRRRRQVPFQYPNDVPFGGPPPPRPHGPPPYPYAWMPGVGVPPPPRPAAPQEVPPPSAPHKPERCMHVEANSYQEEGWICHECQIYNGMQRSECRQCHHERCDDIVGGADVPSGSA